MAEPTLALNPSGKQQLRASGPKINDHHAIISYAQFQDSINMALLHYQQLMTQGTADSNGAAANMFKLKGAQEFVHQFIYLAEEIRPMEVLKPKSSALDHTA